MGLSLVRMMKKTWLILRISEEPRPQQANRGKGPRMWHRAAREGGRVTKEVRRAVATLVEL